MTMTPPKRPTNDFPMWDKALDWVSEKSKTHPGIAESMIPVYGPAREAIADAQEGDWGGAAMNAGFAALDLTAAGEIGKGLKLADTLIKARKAKGLSLAYKNMRPAIRKELGAKRDIEEIHHAGEQNWGWPNEITNHPLNLKVLPKEVHRRIHGRYLGKPKYNWAERTWHGSPTWAQMTGGALAGHGVSRYDAIHEDDD
jgi:hypothetical protein